MPNRSGNRHPLHPAGHPRPVPAEELQLPPEDLADAVRSVELADGINGSAEAPGEVEQDPVVFAEPFLPVLYVPTECIVGNHLSE